MSVPYLEEIYKKDDESGFRDGDLDIDMAYTMRFLEHFFTMRRDDRLNHLNRDLHILNDIITTTIAKKLKDPALGPFWPRADMTVENLYSARENIEIYKRILLNTYKADGGRFDVRLKFNEFYRPLLAWVNCYLKKMQKSLPAEYAAATGSKKRALSQEDDGSCFMPGRVRDDDHRTLKRALSQEDDDSCFIPSRVRDDDYGTFNGFYKP
jgi:hypothetical protein